MRQLTISEAIDDAFHAGRRDPKPGERVVYDDGFTRFFVTDPPELLRNIERTKMRYLADPKVWADALSDFATDQACRALDGKLTHACFDALVAGDTAQFGALVDRTLRPYVEQKAEDDARDDWDEAFEAQVDREIAAERRAEEAERSIRAISEGTP